MYSIYLLLFINIFIIFFKKYYKYKSFIYYINIVLLYMILSTFYLDFSKFIYLFSNFLLNFCFYGKIINYFNNGWLNFVGIVITTIMLYYILYSFNKVIKIYNYKNNFIFTKITFLLIFLLCTFWEQNFFNKFNYKELPFTLQFVNTSLANTLVVIHPFFTHILYGLLFILLAYTYNSNIIFFCKTRLIKVSQIMYFIFLQKKHLMRGAFFVSCWILYLGGWWASQELIWNNWWSWDFVEMMSLMFTTLMLEFLHFFKKRNIIKYTSIIYLTLPVYVIFLFFFIRYDLSMSLHSFNLFELSEFFFFQILLLFSSILLFFILRKLKYSFLIKSFEEKLKKTPQFEFNIFIWVFFKFILIGILFFCVDVLINISTSFNLKNEIIYLYSNNYKCAFLITFLSVFLNWKKNSFLIFFFFIKIIFYKIVELLLCINFIKITSSIFGKNDTNNYIVVALHVCVLVMVVFFDLLSLTYTYFYEWSTNFFLKKNDFFFYKKEIFLFYKNYNVNNLNHLSSNILVNYGLYTNNHFLLNLKIFENDYLFNNWVELIYNFYIKTNLNSTYIYNIIFNEKTLLVFSINYFIFLINSFIILLLYNVYLSKKNYNLKV